MKAMRVSLLLAALGAAGCLSPEAGGPKFSMTPVAPDAATVYVYRPAREFNHGGHAFVFVNGEKKFPLLHKGFKVMRLKPGTYELKVEGSSWETNWWPRPAARTLGVEAGREYFVRAVPALPPGVKAGPHLFRENNVSRTLIELVPPEQALEEIRSLSLVPDEPGAK